MKRAWEDAARRGDADALRAQLDAGAEVDALDRHGQTALMLAAQRGHLAAVRVLLEAGADRDRAAKFGLTATHLAALNEHERVARALAAAGADLRRTGSGAPGFAGRTAADLARERGLEALAAALEPDDGGG